MPVDGVGEAPRVEPPVGVENQARFEPVAVNGLAVAS